MIVDQDLFLQAAEIVSRAGYGSTPLLCEELGIGYNRARQCIDALRQARILGAYHDDKWELIRPIGFY